MAQKNSWFPVWPYNIIVFIQQQLQEKQQQRMVGLNGKQLDLNIALNHTDSSHGSHHVFLRESCAHSLGLIKII